LIIEVTPRIIRPDFGLTDAGNFTSDGYQILDKGKQTDFKAIEPAIKEMENVGSLQKEIRDFNDEVTTPVSEKK